MIIAGRYGLPHDLACVLLVGISLFFFFVLLLSACITCGERRNRVFLHALVTYLRNSTPAVGK